MREKIEAILREARLLVFFLLAVAMLGGVAFMHLDFKQKVIELGYALSQENNKGRALVRQRRELELERAIMKNPEEMARKAGEQFGMHIPDKGQLVTIRGEGKK